MVGKNHICEYWSDPRYVIFNVLRQIIYEPLSGTVPNLDVALYRYCKEAVTDCDFNVFEFYSAKIWINIRAQYESANPEAANAKLFENTLPSRPTTIGYHPLSDFTSI